MTATLNIDDELAAQLKRAAERQGVTLDEIVNAALRQALSASLTGHDFGNLPDFNYDKAWDLLLKEEVEQYRAGKQKAP